MIGQLVWDYPRLSYVTVLCAVALPFVLALRRHSNPGEPSSVQWYQGSMLALGGVLIATTAIRYLGTAHSGIGGVDFFYFICFARDYLHDATGQTLARYYYFPGGYRFWELMMALFGEELPTLQLIVLAILGANAILTGAVVSRCASSPAAGIVAGFWYLALGSRVEMLEGTTEPIATLFALAGLLAWRGMPLRGAPGWRRALLLGAFLGLAAWTKQQGGLIAAGTAVLAFNYACSRSGERDCAWQIVSIPAAAICIFLAALLLEGHGLEPLRIGLGSIGQYDASGSIYSNLAALFKQLGIAFWFVLLAFFLWIAMLGSSVFSGVRQEPWMAVVGFALIAVLATTAQFAKRSYFHYVLLAAPFLAIAVTSIGARIAQSAGAASPRLRPIFAIAAAGLFFLPAVAPASAGFLQVWPPVWNPVVAQAKPWHQRPEIAADLRSLAKLLRPGEDVLLLPPRRNVVHLLNGTRSLSSPWGYGWDPFDASKSVESGSLTAVVVLDQRTFDADDSATCERAGCDRAVAALPERGFRKVESMKTMTVWRRDHRPRNPAESSAPDT